MEAKTKKDISHFLRSKKISPTAQRVEMAHRLLGQPQHLSAEEIFEKVNEEFAQASRATIYNNLNLFVESGILKKVNINSNQTMYDTNYLNHFHLFNQQSGEVTDVNDEKFVKEFHKMAANVLGKVIGSKKKLRVKDIQITFEEE